VNGIPLALVELQEAGLSRGPWPRPSSSTSGTPNRRKSPVPEGKPEALPDHATARGPPAASGPCSARSPAAPEHYQAWRDPYPYARDELAQRLKKKESAVTRAGHPDRHGSSPAPGCSTSCANYVTFMQTDDGKTIKAAPAVPAVPRGLQGDRAALHRQDEKAGRPPGSPRRPSSGTPRARARA